MIIDNIIIELKLEAKPTMERLGSLDSLVAVTDSNIIGIDITNRSGIADDPALSFLRFISAARSRVRRNALYFGVIAFPASSTAAEALIYAALAAIHTLDLYVPYSIGVHSRLNIRSHRWRIKGERGPERIMRRN